MEEVEADEVEEVAPIRTLFHYATATYRTYTVICHGNQVHTTVTSDPYVVDYWLHRLYHEYHDIIRLNLFVVGLGVQWRRNHHFPATLQLCTGYQCLIIQLQHLDFVPFILRHFLSNSAITFVGVSINDDAIRLRRSRHNLSVSRLLELRLIANARWRLPAWPISLETLAWEILGLPGIVNSRLVSASNWNWRVLSDEQVEYCVIDAFISCLLGLELRAWNWNRMVY